MQHYTKNTESARAWCNQCKTFTDHKVSNGILNKHHCLPCADKQEADHQRRMANPEPPIPVQEALFV